MGAELEDNTYFYTERRWHELEEAIKNDRVQLDHSAPLPKGTVGAVACDQHGNLAAATSTGGMTNKKFGRIGDTPLIGAGTYADDICAVSCTGHGEFFMRGVTAYDVAARMKYRGSDLQTAADESIAEMTTLGGEGGLIAVDSQGNIALPFNSSGMYRGSVTPTGVLIEIYKTVSK
jgi:beta-aspartyl-peptidase (threonine type)